MTPRLSRTLLAVLGVVLLLAAACGSDGSASTDGQAVAAPVTGSDTPEEDTPEEDMPEMSEEDNGHSHSDGVEIAEGAPVPTVAVEVVPDDVSGINVSVQFTNFAVTPLSASSAPVDGEGHMHLLIDGEKVGRFYNTDIHVADISPGDHLVEVELNANNHAALTIGGQPVRAGTNVTVGDSDHAHADHSAVEVAAGPDAPSVTVTVTEDPMAGWNVQAVPSNFTITPDRVNADHVDGEGHMHLYIDGEKQGRLYGEWTYIAALTAGPHEIAVGLSTNQHGDYTIDGEPILGVATVDVSADRAAAPTGHSDGDEHGDEHGGDDGEGHDSDGDEHGGDDGEGHDSDGDEHGGDDGHDAEGEGHSAAPDAEGEGHSAAPDADVVVEVSYAGGAVTVDESRVEVERGQTVAVVVTGDTADEVHVHGYDLYGDVSPEAPAVVTFTADVPGIFEVELESSHEFLFELQVS